MAKKTDREFIAMLAAWAQRYDPDEHNQSDGDTDEVPQSVIIRMGEIALSRRGDAQKLPSSVLSPI